MVTKLQLDKAELSTCLKSELKKLLDDSISALKDSLIDSLKASNLELQNKVLSNLKRELSNWRKVPMRRILGERLTIRLACSIIV